MSCQPLLCRHPDKAQVLKVSVACPLVGWWRLSVRIRSWWLCSSSLARSERWNNRELGAQGCPPPKCGFLPPTPADLADVLRASQMSKCWDDGVLGEGTRRGFEMTSACRCEEGWPSRWRLCWTDGIGNTGTPGLAWFSGMVLHTAAALDRDFTVPRPSRVGNVLESHQGWAVFTGLLPPAVCAHFSWCLSEGWVDQREPQKFRNCSQTLSLGSVRLKNLCG